MRIAWSVVVVACLLASGCAVSGAAAAHERLEVVRACEVSCNGSIGTDSSAAPSVATVATPDAAAPFHASVRLARVSLAQADALVASGVAAPGAGAFVVTSDSAERALGGPAGLFAGQRFTTVDRAAGVVAFERQTSFVERFDFTETDRAALVDPIVGIYTTGNRLTLLPRRNDGDDSWTIELALRSVDADRPALNASVGILGTGTPIRFDVPILARVETKTSATLARGESLVVVAPELLRGDACVVAIVTPD